MDPGHGRNRHAWQHGLLDQRQLVLGTVAPTALPAGDDSVAHKLPDVLLRVQLWALGGPRHDRDVVGHGQLVGQMPPGLIDPQRRVPAGRALGRNGRQVQAHRLGVAPAAGSGPGRRLPSLGQMAPKM